jgi:starch phosphorylase
MRVAQAEEAPLKQGSIFHVPVYLDELDCDAIQVDLYAESLDRGEPVREVMLRGEPLIGAQNAYQYTAAVAATRPAGDSTPRIIPYHSAASVPSESPPILSYIAKKPPCAIEPMRQTRWVGAHPLREITQYD